MVKKLYFYNYFKQSYSKFNLLRRIMGIGDWGLVIGDWGLAPIPNPQSPIPNPQSPLLNKNYKKLLILN